MKAILVVSFGTSVNEARIKNIESLEKQMGEAFFDRQIFRAFTSETIIEKLKKRDGLLVHSLPQAMSHLKDLGVTDLVVQPTHMICGFEYHRVMEQVRGFRGQFQSLFLGQPLLYGQEAYKPVVQAIGEELPGSAQGQAFVLLGHGTEHSCQGVYQAVQHTFWQMGHQDVYIGTVEADPGARQVLCMLKEKGMKQVILLPFMLVAGDHACHDMAGEKEDSWKSIFEQGGIKVQCLLKGLGEYRGIRDIYVDHARRAVAI